MPSQNLLAALEPLVSRVRTDVTAIKGPNGMAWTREALTEARLKRHLDGSLPRGVCPIKEGESTTRVAVFDLDSHKGATPWPEMTRIAEELMTALEQRFGCWPVAFRSSGGTGIHVFVVWGEPQDAWSVREMGREALAAIGFLPGAHKDGVAAKKIEVFPKQDSVPEGGFGNQFILPLAGKSAPLEPLADYEVMPREYALQIDWRASRPVPMVERPVRVPTLLDVAKDHQFVGGQLMSLKEALDAIPNDTDPLGYDEWRDIVSAVHHATGGSEEGYALALEFSARAPHFDQDEFDDKVWTWLDRKGHSANPITERTLFAKAREYGWQDQASPDDFPDLTPAVSEKGVGQTDLPLPAFQRDGNGKIEAIVGNVRAALLRPDVVGMDIRFDEFRAEIVFAEPDQPGQWLPFKDQHYFDLRYTLERIGFKPVGRELIRDGVHWMAAVGKIDTAQIWLDGLSWDGKPRVNGFYARYFGVPEGDYATAVSRYVWTAMAGRVLVPGIQADMVPILTGPQGQRKTGGVRAMVPLDTFREMNFHQSEEERARLMRGCLMVELGELSGLKTRENEQIKAWITRRKEDWTPKYQEYAVSLLRRCLMQGTSNPTELLDDPTGSRRWLPLASGNVDVAGIERDREQLWAEARTLFLAGGIEWEAAQRLALDVHDDYRVHDVWEGALRVWLDTPGLGDVKPRDQPFQLREAMVDGLGMPDRTIKRADEQRAAKALKAIGYERKKARWDGGAPSWRWVVPDSSDLA